MAKRKPQRLNNPPIPTRSKTKKHCGFCKNKSRYVDYRDETFLKVFLNPQGKILHKRYRGNCQKHQKIVATAIKRCRQIARLPYVVDNLT